MAIEKETTRLIVFLIWLLLASFVMPYAISKQTKKWSELPYLMKVLLFFSGAGAAALFAAYASYALSWIY